jgi:hypothetical protein
LTLVGFLLLLYCTIAITVFLVLRAILFILFFGLNSLGCKPNLERSSGALRLRIIQVPESTNRLEIDIRAADKTHNTQTSKTSTSGDTLYIVESIPSGVATVTVRALDAAQILEIKQELVQIGQNTTAELKIDMGHARSPSDAGFPDRHTEFEDATVIDSGADVEDIYAIDSGPVDMGIAEDSGFIAEDTGQAAMMYTSGTYYVEFAQIDSNSLQGTALHTVGILDGTAFRDWITLVSARIGAAPSKIRVASMVLILNPASSRSSSLTELWNQLTVALESTRDHAFAEVGNRGLSGVTTRIDIPVYADQSGIDHILSDVLNGYFVVTIKGPTIQTPTSPNFGANLTLEMVFVAE